MALRFDGLEEILTAWSRRNTFKAACCVATPPCVRSRVHTTACPDVHHGGGSSRSETAATALRAVAAARSAAGLHSAVDALVAHRDLVVLAWMTTPVAFLRPRVGELVDSTLERVGKWASCDNGGRAQSFRSKRGAAFPHLLLLSLNFFKTQNVACHPCSINHTKPIEFNFLSL